jgi:glycosyltransferase involved in cell wall biosynthesis
MQRTNFLFEVLINDDASTDDNQRIIREYEKRYPGIIKPIYHRINQFSKGKLPFFDFNLPRVQGKYIALCEGDDYWTDPDKLQRQVDYMEKHPKCTVCFHPVVVRYDGSDRPDEIYPPENNGFTLDALLERNFIQTNSVMYRKQKTYAFPKTSVMPGDWYMHIYHAKFGRIGFIDEAMSVYRRWSGGIWSSAGKDLNAFWHNQAVSCLRFFIEVKKLFVDDGKKQEIITNSAANVLSRIIDEISSTTDPIISKIVADFPSIVCRYIQLQKQTKNEMQHQVQEAQKLIIDKDNIIADRDRLITDIANSKSYKLGQLLSTPYRKIRRKW